MSTDPVTSHDSVHNLLDGQLESLRATMHELFERATTKPTWFGRVVNRTADTIKAHPLVAAGVALGLGFVASRIARRAARAA